jgi:hypothetical protein
MEKWNVVARFGSAFDYKYGLSYLHVEIAYQCRIGGAGTNELNSTSDSVRSVQLN